MLRSWILTLLNYEIYKIVHTSMHTIANAAFYRTVLTPSAVLIIRPCRNAPRNTGTPLSRNISGPVSSSIIRAPVRADSRLHTCLHRRMSPTAAVRRLLPETADLPITIHQLPNLLAINVVIERLLGRGVADSTRLDPQAKGLGEQLRARLVDVPTRLLGEDQRPLQPPGAPSCVTGGEQ